MSCCTTHAPAPHAFDPLSESEIASAVSFIKKEKALDEHTRFSFVFLHEPSKGETNPTRQAAMTILNVKTGFVAQAVVDITLQKLVSFTPRDTSKAPYGQPMVMIEEFFKAEAIVKADSGWRKAMMRRGLSDTEIELVQVDPFSAGYFGREVEKGKRLVSAVSYYRENIKDNGYSHPIEGVVALVDLIAEQVVHLVDEEKIIPIPKTKHNYNRESFTPRTTLKPLTIVQSEGVSFSVEGWQVKWQDWDFRVGFTPREGLVLHHVNIQNRSLLYRASITEMAVPYADPTANHFWKCAFDAGEYGLGKLANALELGCDCLGTIHYFDVPAVDDEGNATTMKNAICLHEEDYGILWKHNEFRNETYETRRSRRLVISFFATVGNYDYGFYWYFYQDGTLQFEAKLTGIIQTAAVHPDKAYPFGGRVTPELGGPTHQHFFNARLNFNIDGDKNSVSEHQFEPRKMGKDNPYGNVFDLSTKKFKREFARKAKGAKGRYWKISSEKTNFIGNKTAYKLNVHDTPLLLAQKGSHLHNRAGFATKHVWVTPFSEAEKYASGEFPNQHAGGDGLTDYIKQKRKIESADIVLWHSFGHTHVCKPEDFPIMPVEYTGFMLKPTGFFEGNIAMDLPAEKNEGSCCA
jgi:primary-amine oxidase